MKKKITGFLMCFVLLCMTLFAGCNLLETNNDKYYNAVVSEIKNKDGKKVAEVTNRELFSAYQSYGQSFVQNFGYTKKEAVDETLRLVENRKITVLTAEKMFTLSSLEKTYLWEATASSLEQNLQSYYDEIVEKEEEKAKDSVKFNGYEKNATLSIVDGKYVVNSIDKNDGLLENYTPQGGEKDISRDEDKELIYTNFLEKIYNDDYQKAYNNYLKNLKLSEQGMKLPSDTDSIFMREIDRLYKIHYENLMVEKYSEYKKGDSADTGVTAQNILDLYASKVRADYTKYVFEEDPAYDEEVKGDVNEAYYIRTDSEATKFFTVANILFQFTEEQKSQYKACTEKYNNANGNGYTHAQYQADLNALYNDIVPVVRQKNIETGEYEEIDVGNLTVDEIVYDEIEIALISAQNTENVNFIGDTINDYIYKYNQDPGMLNAEANYVIGVDKDGKAVSNFVQAFNEAGIKLFDNGNGKIGDMAIAKTEFGIHVLVYTGTCMNLFDGIDGNFTLSATEESGAIEKLYSTRVNPLVDKTYFDMLYDEIYQDKFSYYETENMKFLRQDYEVVVYKGRIPNSLTAE